MNEFRAFDTQAGRDFLKMGNRCSSGTSGAPKEPTTVSVRELFLNGFTTALS